jgi:hypothetical protein
VNAVKLLLVVAVLSPLLALWSTQDPAATDWAKDVERACTSPRYGLRLAAARKVAKGGAAAIPAVREFATKNGLNALPAALVDAFADDGGDDAAVRDLLWEWANEPTFYWRAAAMRGIALRVPRLPEKPGLAMRAVMKARYHDDPAWLMRTHARFGTVLCGDDAPLTLPEADPRARARLPLLLLLQGKVPPLQPLLDALADERTFMEVPWAQGLAGEVHKALKTWLGDAHPAAGGGALDDKAKALVALTEACRTKSGQTLTVPELRRDPPTVYTGGIELLSCQHGDQFVQWTAAGELALGIDGASRVTIAAPAWDTLTKARTELTLPEGLGVVVCDSLRLRCTEPPVHSKVAPAHLPAPATNWLKQLAQAIEEAGEPRLAAALRAGLEQFAAR